MRNRRTHAAAGRPSLAIEMLFSVHVGFGVAPKGVCRRTAALAVNFRMGPAMFTASARDPAHI